MRAIVPVLSALALVSCFKKSLPPVPPELTAALDDFGRACNGEPGAPALSYVSEKLLDQMGMYQGQGVPVGMQADLQTLKREVAVIAAQWTNGDLEARRKWAELRPKIDRVLQGENPTPGPRYQVDQPQEVTFAIAEADAAFSRGDKDALAAPLGRARRAICEWAEKMPGPRGGRMMQVCSDEFDGLTMSLSYITLEQARAQWEGIKARIQPGGQ
jgi:hypothetical protein